MIDVLAVMPLITRATPPSAHAGVWHEVWAIAWPTLTGLASIAIGWLIVWQRTIAKRVKDVPTIKTKQDALETDMRDLITSNNYLAMTYTTGLTATNSRIDNFVNPAPEDSRRRSKRRRPTVTRKTKRI